MAIEAQTVEYNYTGDGVTTSFPFPSRFLRDEDLTVVLDGVEQVSGYAVSGAGGELGGYVVFTAPPALAATVMLLRKPPISQLTNFIDNMTVLAENLDDALDKLTMIAQFYDRRQDRTFRIGDYDAPVPPGSFVLPTAAARRGKLLGFTDTADAVPTVVTPDLDGNGTVAIESIVGAGAEGKLLLAATTPLAAQTLLGNEVVISTRAALAGTTLAASIKSARVLGYSAEADGGYARYEKMPAAPAVTKAFHINVGGTGNWFRIADKVFVPRMFGAIGNDAADDTTALRDWLSSGLGAGAQMLMEGHTHVATDTIDVDLTDVWFRGFSVDGSGWRRSEIRWTGLAANQTGLTFHSTFDPFDSGFTDFMGGAWRHVTLRSSHDGPVVKLGADDYSGPNQVWHFDTMAVLNSFTGFSAECIRMNVVLNSTFTQVHCSGYADTISGAFYGVGLNIRGARFVTFVNGAFGGAHYGVHMPAAGTTTYGLTWAGAGTFEVTDRAIFIENPNTYNCSVVGGSFSYYQLKALTNTAGLAGAESILSIHDAHFGEGSNTDMIDPAFGRGIKVTGAINAPTTPAMPASEAVITNISGQAVEVTMLGGTLSSTNVSGIDYGANYRQFIWNPWETLAVVYTGSPLLLTKAVKA